MLFSHWALYGRRSKEWKGNTRLVADVSIHFLGIINLCASMSGNITYPDGIGIHKFIGYIIMYLDIS